MSPERRLRRSLSTGGASRSAVYTEPRPAGLSGPPARNTRRRFNVPQGCISSATQDPSATGFAEDHCGIGSITEDPSRSCTPQRKRAAPGVGHPAFQGGDLVADAHGLHSPRSGVSPRPAKRMLRAEQDTSRVLHGACALSSAAETPPTSVRGAEAVTQLHRAPGGAVGLTLDDRLMVTGVAPGSAAAAAGIRVGSVLRGVNGRRITSQEAAVAAFRESGDTISVSLTAQGPTGRLEPHEMPTAGAPTDAIDARSSSPSRRRQGPMPACNLSALMRTSTPPAPSRLQRPGLGPPGLGPMREAWGNAERQHGAASGGRSAAGGGAARMESHFKPNTYVPPRDGASSPGGRGRGGFNKTSYELALERGHCSEEGHWDAPQRPQRNAVREQYHRTNGSQGPDLLYYDERGSGQYSSPRVAARGLNRAAVPERAKEAATGGLPRDPEGTVTPRQRGLRRPDGTPQNYGLNPELLAHDPTVTDVGTSKRGGTPLRARDFHQCHGDIIAHGPRHGAGATAVEQRRPVGRQTHVDTFVPPEITPLAPRLRGRQATSRQESDIFHRLEHRPGAVQDMPGCRAGGKARSPAPSSARRMHRYTDLAG
eukprot:TRINITY_DN1730_c0_g1_i1.p1 TRINITY_DN1730_c0_g1~~TRINITY_DN1730_c0_g1_i1.p1  ORF type:complete len:626 (+),score=149.42 TRINITY_DN1730_c0_g1_i1:90-1880(+)